MGGLEGFNSRTYTHTNNGDLKQIQWNATQKSSFVYDVMGNLKQVTLPSGQVLDYKSDGMDRRAEKRTAGIAQWRYLYEDQYRVATQLSPSSNVQRRFVYATRVNVPDYFISLGGEKFRVIMDHLGSPRLIVRIDNGSISQRMDYTVLGEVTNNTNPSLQPFGFAGGIYDPDTQLVRFGARDYDPRSGGRWTTKDPIRFMGGDVNLYGYVLNDPVNITDPSGLIHPAVATGAVGAAVGFGAAFMNSKAKTKCGFAVDLALGTLSGAAAGALAAVGAGGTSMAGAVAGGFGGLGSGAGFFAIDLFGPSGDDFCGCK